MKVIYVRCHMIFQNNALYVGLICENTWYIDMQAVFFAHFTVCVCLSTIQLRTVHSVVLLTVLFLPAT